MSFNVIYGRAVKWRMLQQKLEDEKDKAFNELATYDSSSWKRIPVFLYRITWPFSMVPWVMILLGYALYYGIPFLVATLILYWVRCYQELMNVE